MQFARKGIGWRNMAGQIALVAGRGRDRGPALPVRSGQ